MVNYTVCVCGCEQMDRFKQGCMLFGQIMLLSMLKQADKEKRSAFLSINVICVVERENGMFLNERLLMVNV